MAANTIKTFCRVDLPRKKLAFPPWCEGQSSCSRPQVWIGILTSCSSELRQLRGEQPKINFCSHEQNYLYSVMIWGFIEKCEWRIQHRWQCRDVCDLKKMGINCRAPKFRNKLRIHYIPSVSETDSGDARTWPTVEVCCDPTTRTGQDSTWMTCRQINNNFIYQTTQLL